MTCGYVITSRRVCSLTWSYPVTAKASCVSIPTRAPQLNGMCRTLWTNLFICGFIFAFKFCGRYWMVVWGSTWTPISTPRIVDAINFLTLHSRWSRQLRKERDNIPNMDWGGFGHQKGRRSVSEVRRSSYALQPPDEILMQKLHIAVKITPKQELCKLK